MNAAASKLVAIQLTDVLLCAGAMPTAAEPVDHTIEHEVDPAKSADVLATKKDASKGTRAFDGCDHFAHLVDGNNPERVSFCEIGESKEHHQAYRSRRKEPRFEATIAPLHNVRFGTNS